ncbi:MAG TPA: hypothetical protein VNO24_00040 [Blastocatellia bacterium]|nr:hypothetical protein [Blastocatellia bacterium]
MTKQQFRVLIVLNWLLTIAAAIVFLSTRTSLPTELKTYLENQKSIGSSADSILLWIDVSLLVFAIAASIGLLLFKRWAKSVLLPVYFVSVLLIPTRAVYIDTGWSQLVFSLANMTGGMILALVFFSPLNVLFDSPGDN